MSPGSTRSGGRLLALALLCAIVSSAAWIGSERTPLPIQSRASRDTINLREIGFYAGAVDAPVTVIEFSDFGCPFCAMFERGTYPGLAAEFVETGMVRWIFVPFASGRFRNGDEAERAARCAARQGGFESMKSRLYAGQREWATERRPHAMFHAYAGEVGLDESRFEACYDGNAVRDAMRASEAAADQLRIRATPSFLIDGQRLEGALPAERFGELLTRAYQGTLDPAP